MTNQEVFDKVVAHLRKQNAKSADNERCLYRAPDGKMCAVGCLIPDEMYDPEMEGATASDEIVGQVLDELKIDWKLALDLQYIHDDYDVEEWEERLEFIAMQYKLEMSAP